MLEEDGGDGVCCRESRLKLCEDEGTESVFIFTCQLQRLFTEF